MTRASPGPLTGPCAAGVLAGALSLALLGCNAGPTSPASPPPPRALRAPLTDPQPRPFHGTITGHRVATIPAPPGRCPEGLPLLATYRGEGVVMPMGEITVEGGECIDREAGHAEALRTGAGEFTFTAVDGERIRIAYDRADGAVAPPWIHWSASIRIRSGTGRFTGAALAGGSWQGGSDPTSGETWAEFDGTIFYWPRVVLPPPGRYTPQ